MLRVKEQTSSAHLGHHLNASGETSVEKEELRADACDAHVYSEIRQVFACVSPLTRL